MRRIASLVVAAVVAWLGLGFLGPVQAAPPIPVQTYAYALHESAIDEVSAATLRGPPAGHGNAPGHDTADTLPSGDPARTDDTNTSEICDYDRSVGFVRTAPGSQTPEKDGDTAAGRTVVERSGVAANAGSGALRIVDEVLSGLPKGNQSWVRMVPDESSLTAKFSELTKGGTPTTWKNFNGTVIERGDGVQVGIRSSSSSGGGAIDIRMPDGSRIRIHVEQP